MCGVGWSNGGGCNYGPSTRSLFPVPDALMPLSLARSRECAEIVQSWQISIRNLLIFFFFVPDAAGPQNAARPLIKTDKEECEVKGRPAKTSEEDCVCWRH